MGKQNTMGSVTLKLHLTLLILLQPSSLSGTTQAHAIFTQAVGAPKARIAITALRCVEHIVLTEAAVQRLIVSIAMEERHGNVLQA